MKLNSFMWVTHQIFRCVWFIFSWLSLSLMSRFKQWLCRKIWKPFPRQTRLNRRKVESWSSVKCSGCWLLRNLAPVVLWEIKTFRGANELFSTAFVSSFNQSPQVSVSATTYAAAALSLQKAYIHCVCACVCVCQSNSDEVFSAEKKRVTYVASTI